MLLRNTTAMPSGMVQTVPPLLLLHPFLKGTDRIWPNSKQDSTFIGYTGSPYIL